LASQKQQLEAEAGMPAVDKIENPTCKSIQRLLLEITVSCFFIAKE